jgi:uncharacterized protein YlxW (UPF0749 family)
LAHVAPAGLRTELDASRQLEVQLEQQMISHKCLVEKMHAMAHEHELKTKELNESAQAALEETLSEVEAVTNKLQEAQSQIASRDSEVESLTVRCCSFQVTQETMGCYYNDSSL